MAVGTAGLAVAGCVVARAPPPRQCLARPCGRAPAAAPAGAWRRAGPHRPGRGHPGVRAGRPGIGGPQLATGRSATMAGPTAAGGRAGPVQPHHRAGPAALAPVAGAGEAGAPARCARGQSGGTGGVCGRCVHGCAADRRCGQHPPVSRRVVAGDHARGWPAGRSRHRLGGAPAVAGGLPQRRHPRVHRSRERRRIQGGLGCARERLRRVRARGRHLDRCGLSRQRRHDRPRRAGCIIAARIGHGRRRPLRAGHDRQHRSRHARRRIARAGDGGRLDHTRRRQGVAR